MLQKAPVFGHTCDDIFSKSSEVIHDLKIIQKFHSIFPDGLPALKKKIPLFLLPFYKFWTSLLVPWVRYKEYLV